MIALVDNSGLQIVATSVSRAFNTNYQNNSGYYMRVRVTCTISCTSTLIAGQTGTVNLLSDTAATPTTQRDSKVHSLAQVLGITVTMTSAIDVDIWCIVPPGSYYRITNAGTATMTIKAADEELYIV